ncbi:MAG TPA: FAD-dependent oxidoreductase [Cellvibrionaceae bacterium]
MRSFDLVIIGAGIHGGGFSYVAAAMGLNCLLVEKSASVGSATSSNSSKLIHGGLRYLESGQIHLVRECLKERARLLAAAPDLVTLQPFYIPIYKSSRRTNAAVALGLGIYQLLGGKHFNHISRAHWEDFPIRQTELTGLWRYWDCQTNDAILTQRVVSAAQQFGCELMLNTQPTAIERIKTSSAVQSYQVNLSNNEQIRSRCVINAAGPWVNEVAALNQQLPRLEIQWVQGSHIVINRPPLTGCFYLESPIDGRPFFVLPWQGQQLIGTTETSIDNPSTAAITERETRYLLTSYNHYFANTPILAKDILRTFCGVRVLPQSAADSIAINHAKRETQLIVNSEMPGYLALYGGKLTSFYATALKGITLLAPLLSASVRYKPIDLQQASIAQPKF